MRNTSIFCVLMMGSGLLEACTRIGGNIKIVNLADQEMLVSYVQTKPSSGAAALYLGKKNAVEFDDIKTALVPPGQEYAFQSCGSVEKEYERAVWVASDADKLAEAFETKSVKSSKGVVAYGVQDSATLYVVKKGKSFEIVASKPQDVDQKNLRELSDQEGLLVEVATSPSEIKSALKSALISGNLAFERVKPKKTKSTLNKYDKMLAVLDKIKTYADYKKFYKAVVPLDGAQGSEDSGGLYALQRFLDNDTNLSSEQKKKAYQAYGRMFVNILNSIEDKLKVDLQKFACSSASVKFPDCSRKLMDFLTVFWKDVAAEFLKPVDEMSSFAIVTKSRTEWSPEQQEVVGALKGRFEKMFVTLKGKWAAVFSFWSDLITSEISTMKEKEKRDMYKSGIYRDPLEKAIEAINAWEEKMSPVEAFSDKSIPSLTDLISACRKTVALTLEKIKKYLGTITFDEPVAKQREESRTVVVNGKLVYKPGFYPHEDEQ